MHRDSISLYRCLSRLLVNLLFNYPFDQKVLELAKQSSKASFSLKAHCRGADWVNKTIKKKRIRQGSVISLYIKIDEDDNDLIPFIIETKYDIHEHKGLVINRRPELCFVFDITTSQSQPRQCAFKVNMVF